MNFDADNPEHSLLREGARRALADAFGLGLLRNGDVVDRDTVKRAWSVAVKMGWTGLRVYEGQGGLGLGMAEACIVAEEMGRALLPAPYVATAALGPALLSRLPATPDRDRMLSGIADGGIMIAAPGLADLGSGTPDIKPGHNAARRFIVEYPDSVSHVLTVVIEPDGAHRASLLPIGAASLSRHLPLDPTCPIATAEIAGAAPRRSVDGILSAADMGEIRAIAQVAVAAELTGVAGASFDLALAYAKERQQFGAPIGSFQAIKHRFVDGFILVDNARTAVRHAADAIDRGESGHLLAADAASSAAIDAAIAVTHDCIQIHGALGFSAEHAAHLYLKRARRLAAGLGGASAMRRAIGIRLARIAVSGADELFSAGSDAA